MSSGPEPHNGGGELARLAAGSIIAAVFAMVGGIAYRLLRHRRSRGVVIPNHLMGMVTHRP